MAITKLDSLKPDDQINHDANGNLSNLGLQAMATAISKFVKEIDLQIYFPLHAGDHRTAHPKRTNKASALVTDSY